jgi:hypothetical protein
MIDLASFAVMKMSKQRESRHRHRSREGVFRRGADAIRKSGVRIVDLFFILAIAALTTGAAVVSYSGGGGSNVSIQSGSSEWIYSLGTDKTIAVPGLVGNTVVEILDNHARVIDSDCRDKICVNMGSLDRRGDWSACLPNGVMVRIVGEREDGIDAIAY